MKLSQRIDEWVKAGVVDAATAARIIAYEQTRGGISFVNGLLGIGGLAIFLGIAAIIGVNWDTIPAFVKITFHLVINTGVATALYTLIQRGKTGMVIDLLAGGLAGLTLTFIALVGQIYQSQDPTWKALALWLVLVSPFLLAVMQSRYLIEKWILAFLLTYGMYIANVDDHTKPLPLILMCSLLPFGMMALGQDSKLRAWRGKTMTQLSLTGFAVLAAAATLSQISWRFTTGWFHEDTMVVAEAFIITMVVAVAMLFARRAQRLVLLPAVVDLVLPISVLFAFLPFFIPHGDWAVVGAGMMMVYWAFCGWAGMQAGYRRALDFAISLIALRLVIVYVEVFGSLLQTGTGLIISGVMLIGLVLGTRKIIARLKPPADGGTL